MTMVITRSFTLLLGMKMVIFDHASVCLECALAPCRCFLHASEKEGHNAIEAPQGTVEGEGGNHVGGGMANPP
jgi:hypothetical protein